MLWTRYMKVLKGYLKNRARPEGCMTKLYAVEECSRHCSGYMKKVAEMGVWHTQNEDFEFGIAPKGRPISATKLRIMTPEMLDIAHRYVLLNTTEVWLLVNC